MNLLQILNVIEQKMNMAEEYVKISTSSSHSEGKYVAYATCKGLLSGKTNVKELEMEASRYITDIRIKRIEGRL